METKAKANQRKRTFTIRTHNAKYRTCVFTKEEFEELECNTSKDWDYFLSTEDFYRLVKGEYLTCWVYSNPIG